LQRKTAWLKNGVIIMPTRKIEKAHWRDFLDTATQELVGAQAEVQVAGLSLGSQIEVEWLGLFGFNYDPRTDTIEIALDGVDHIVQAPRELWVDIDDKGLVTLEIVGADETRQIVRLREPLRLAPPEPAKADGG
jgi:uncharacterized protein YuzE